MLHSCILTIIHTSYLINLVHIHIELDARSLAIQAVCLVTLILLCLRLFLLIKAQIFHCLSHLLFSHVLLFYKFIFGFDSAFLNYSALNCTLSCRARINNFELFIDTWGASHGGYHARLVFLFHLILWQYNIWIHTHKCRVSWRLVNLLYPTVNLNFLNVVFSLIVILNNIWL